MDDRQQRIARGFDRLSRVYDQIVKLIFGNALIELQRHVPEGLKTPCKVLMIGGGSGELLPFLLEECKAEEIHFVELSDRMKRLARKRLNEDQEAKVKFHESLPAPNHSLFDLILLPFVLDCYNTGTILEMLEDCRWRMAPNAQLVITDFSNDPETGYHPNWIKSRVIQLLYLFFRWTTSIEARSLSSFDALARKAGFEMVKKYERYKGWVQSTQWKLANAAQPTE